MNASESPITLETLNTEEMMERIPTLVYLSLVMIIGIPGNALVILIYFGSLWKLEGSHWTFIRTITIVDFLICIIIIPFEFYQQTHQLTFYAESACKSFKVISVHLSAMASLLLVMMSANRMYRIWWPLKVPLSSRQALVSVIILGIFVTAVSWPEGKLSGINLKQRKHNITGYDCGLEDRYKRTIYPFAYSVVLLVGFVLCVSSLITMYAIIWNKLRKKDYFRSTSSAHSQIEIPVESSVQTVVLEDESSVSNNKTVSQKIKGKFSGSSTKSLQRQRNTSQRNRESRKVTKIAFVISIAFILSYLPFITVKMVSSLSKGQYMSDSFIEAIIPILSRCFLLNNIINPFVYVCLDQTFLIQCKRVLLCRHRCNLY
ncbi:trace amine-associated receptor 13c-like [Mytilus californianus]|uniref:trace amine-associated receptor 13c-like n=1 Tax=Mytilus californianus TaxID=6549 RepID=UPI0022473960|nr:trace amine-associated receptor 13c-like [Mytilus californianus]XP_052067139.1 trace amine-associated receptor 13c-like [Mytilus californianus]XP_052067140.1 trace amine-associated receptor 13c-like [Mytilus californianus]